VDALATFATDWVWLVIALPLAGAVVNHLIGSRLPEPLPGLIATAASAGAFGVAVLAALPWLTGAEHHAVTKLLWEWMPSVGATLEVRWDTLSMTMALLVTGVGTIIHLYSIGYMHGDPRHARYFTWLNLFAASMLVLVLGNNFAMVFLGWELVGLCSYLLISFWFTKEEAAAAGRKAFVLNRVGDVGFMVGVMVLFATFGSLSFDVVLDEPGRLLGPGTALAVGLLFLLGAAGKSAQIPLYVWLPDAMAGPTPASALIHAATMVTAGVYLVARTAAIYELAPAALVAVATVGAFTALLAATIAIAQHDIKKVLAYSTISQLGFMFLAVGSAAHVAGIFHLLTHAFFKALLFLGAGSVIHGMHEEQDIRKMGGLWRKMPVTAATMAVATLAIAGIPPLAGFWSKDEILSAAFARGGWYQALWAIGLLTALLTAFYMTRWFVLVFLGAPRWDDGVHPHESSPVMTVPLVALAGLSIVGGFMNTPFWHGLEYFLEPSFEGVAIQHITEGTVGYVLIAVAVLVAVLGVALGWVIHTNAARRDRFERVNARPLAAMAAGWGVEDAYRAAIVRPGERVAAGAAAFDARVVDGAVNGVGGLVRRAGGILRPIQNGAARSYVAVLAGGAIAFAVWFVVRGT
jgi:NADH-quinone oxidoreductase subunit L